MLKLLPSYIKFFIYKFLIFVLIFSLARLAFYFGNHSLFPVVYFKDFMIGIWFDSITISILFLPLIIIELLPHNYRNSTSFKILLKTLFILILSLGTLMNIADIEYFKFSSTRSNISTLKMLSYGNDFSNQLPSFIKDYWILFLIYILLLILGYWLYNKIDKLKIESIKIRYQIAYFFIGAAIIVSIGRGWGVRPISPINASKYTIDQNVPLVLNSTFTIIKSIGNSTLKEKDYFKNDNELIKWFNPIHQYQSNNSASKQNVVLIMLESFSVEYIRSINGDSISYTPFLDSLISEGLIYTNCYANGKKSIDAVPSVIASIPKLMDQEFITSNYATNTIESLPKQLKRFNYHSAFFHGATNGSMNFDQFAGKARFDEYLGRTEYNNDDHFDGTWGIFDHNFMLWSIDKMNEFKKPFFSTLFSLSSHPPYTIPEHLVSKFQNGPTPMYNSVKYTDYALKLFFEKVKQMTWYDNTIFIITADHTPASDTPIYFKERGNMHIPLLFFQPGNKKLKGKSKKIVSQVDIMPSILDLVGYHYPFLSFGESVFKNKYGFSVSKLGSKYLIFGYQHFLVFKNGKVLKMYHIDDKLQKHGLKRKKPELLKFLKNKLLAYIQTYHNSMIKNKLTIELFDE